MSVGKEEQIFVATVHAELRWVVLEVVEILGDKVFYATERSPRMSALHGCNHSDDIASYLRTDFLQFFCVGHVVLI